MSAIAGGNGKRKRKCRTPAGPAGERQVVGEPFRRGFNVQRANHNTVLVGPRGSPPKRVFVRSSHLAPWYVRGENYFGIFASQVTVYVLLGLENPVSQTRFFVAKNSDLTADFRQPPDWKEFGLLDIEALEKYENNWNILR
jgi:hypothetical protein